MKKFIAVLLSAAFAVTALSACSINININQPTEAAQSASTEADVPATAAPETEAPATEAPVGTLSDYVRTANEITKDFGDGSTNTLRLPEILLDNADAKAANSEISEKFGDTDNSGAYELDYEAYLNGKVLSVVITSKNQGGNSYALTYNFDVTSGSAMDNQSICDVAGESYSDVLADLRDELTDYYDEKWGALSGNDTERDKTYSDENLREAKLYLDGEGDIMAVVDIYAAVGGGHWFAQLEI